MTFSTVRWFESPVDFNDSQTPRCGKFYVYSFESHVDFNDSQTVPQNAAPGVVFESPVDFNDSQLNNLKIDAKYGLRAL